MAILPIRLGRDAKPEIGGPKSTPSLGYGQGVQRLGAGIADAGISIEKKKTKEHKAEEAYNMHSAVLRATSEMLNGAKQSRDEAENGQMANEKYETVSKDIIAQHTAGMTEDQAKEFKNRIEGQNINFRNSVNEYGRSIDKKNKIDAFDTVRKGTMNAIYDNPATLDSWLDGFDTLTDSFMESENIPEQDRKNFKTETRRMGIKAAINGNISGGRLDAEEALKDIDKYTNDLTVEESASLKNKANEVIRSAIARSEAIIMEKVQIQGGMEKDNVPTTEGGEGFTPEKARADALASGSTEEFANLAAWGVRKNIIAGEVRRQFVQRPNDQLTARISELSDSVSQALIEGGADIRAVGGAFQEQMAELDELKQLQLDMGNKPLETISKYSTAMREQDAVIRNLGAQTANSEDPEALGVLIVEAKGVRSKLLSDLGMQINGDRYSIPLADSDEIARVTTMLNNPQVSAEDKAKIATDLLLANGVAAMPQVVSTYFTGEDSQEWQYISQMLLNDPANGQRAIDAYFGYDENTKSNLYTDTAKGVVEKATSTEAMDDFTSTFRGTNGSTAAKAAQVIQRMTVADIARGADPEASLAKNTKDVLKYSVIGIEYDSMLNPFDSSDRSQSFRVPNSNLNPYDPQDSLKKYTLGQKAINSKAFNSILRDIWPDSFSGLDQESFELLDLVLTNDDNGIGGYIDLNYDGPTEDMGETRHASRTTKDDAGKMVFKPNGKPKEDKIVIPYKMIAQIGEMYEDISNDPFAGRAQNAPEHELNRLRETAPKDSPVDVYIAKRDAFKANVKWMIEEHYKDIDTANRLERHLDGMPKVEQERWRQIQAANKKAGK